MSGERRLMVLGGIGVALMLAARVLAHVEEPADRSQRERRLVQSSIATERADELGNDDALHDQLLTVITLATQLDYEAREQALALVPTSWWAERTVALDEQRPPLGPLG